ncbi:MAG: CheY-like chemotaxis protein [Rhodothermales bacterium]|jgi:CheY-like chemotaxis protein
MTKKPPHILVAEDNQINLELVSYMLEQMNYGYSVAEDGAVAVEKFNNESISLILMDCHMGGMDGFQATQEIRRIESEASDGKRVPIVALTANAIMGDKKKCLEIGMDDYLSKPFKFRQLQQLLEKWLLAEDESAATPAKEKGPADISDNSEMKDVDFQSVEAIYQNPQFMKKLV